MAWTPPFDAKGRLAGSKQILTLGTAPSAHVIPLTQFRRRGETQNIKAKDSGDWDATDLRLYGTSLNIGVDTTFTLEGFMRLSETPDWVIATLYAGGDVAFDYKPDGVNTLISGTMKTTNFEDTYPAEDWCTFTADAEVQGKPVRGANISVP